MPMSCNFPMECRRWASTSSSWLVFILSSLRPPLSWQILDGTVGLTDWDAVRRYIVGMRVSCPPSCPRHHICLRSASQNCGICYAGPSSECRCHSEQPEPDGSPRLRPGGMHDGSPTFLAGHVLNNTRTENLSRASMLLEAAAEAMALEAAWATAAPAVVVGMEVAWAAATIDSSTSPTYVQNQILTPSIERNANHPRSSPTRLDGRI